MIFTYCCFYLFSCIGLRDLHRIMQDLSLQHTDTPSERVSTVVGEHGLGCSAACWVLVPRPGIETVFPALEGILNHWTTKEIPDI